MSSERFLVLDLGSSVGKVTLFSSSGELLAQDATPYQTYSPEPDAAIQDPEEWWRVYQQLIPPLVSRYGMPDALGVTGQMHGVVALSTREGALGSYYTLRDRRCLSVVPEMEQIVTAEDVYRVTGSRLSAAAPAAKLYWLKRNYHEHFKRASVFLPAKDYLRWRLTGEVATEPIDAAGMVLYDLLKSDWSDELLSTWGVPKSKLPPISSSTTIAGVLQAGPARDLGLKSGIPVITGAGDDIEFLGAGVMEPGQGLEHLGTTGSLLICQDKLIFDPGRRLEVSPHVVPGLWLVGGSTGTAGATLRWVADLLELDELDPPDTAAYSKNAPILIPYLAGERSPLWEPSLRGILLGLDLSHDRRDIVWAAFEGVTYSLKHILEVLKEVSASPDALVVTDAKSIAWTSMRASIYDLPLRVPMRPEATAFGTLMLMSVGIGQFQNVQAATNDLVRFSHDIHPDKKLVRNYERRFNRYLQASATIQAWSAP